MTGQDEITKLRAERDALAAALERAKKQLEKLTAFIGWLPADPKRMGEEHEALLASLSDSAAILAAHDAEERKPLKERIAALEAALLFVKDAYSRIAAKGHGGYDWNRDEAQLTLMEGDLYACIDSALSGSTSTLDAALRQARVEVLRKAAAELRASVGTHWAPTFANYVDRMAEEEASRG